MEIVMELIWRKVVPGYKTKYRLCLLMDCILGISHTCIVVFVKRKDHFHGTLLWYGINNH